MIPQIRPVHGLDVKNGRPRVARSSFAARTCNPESGQKPGVACEETV